MLFQRAEVFYSYDTATFVSIHAAMCGCESVVLPYGDYETWKDQPNYKYAIAWGEEERAQKKEELPLVRPYLDILASETSVMIDKLIFDLKHWR